MLVLGLIAVGLSVSIGLAIPRFGLGPDKIALLHFGLIDVSCTCLLVLTLREYVSRKNYRKSCERDPVNTAPIRWLFQSDVVILQSEFESTKYRWSDFAQVVETRHGFLLYQDPVHFAEFLFALTPTAELLRWWLPQGGFLSDEDIRQFAMMARTHVQSYIVEQICRYPE